MDQQGLGSIALSTAVAAIGFTLMGFFVGWSWVFIRWNNQQPILEFEPRRPVPWTVVSLAVAILAFVVAVMAVSLVVQTMAVPGPVAELNAPAAEENAGAVSGPLPLGNETLSEARSLPPSNAPSNQPLAPREAKRPFPTFTIWLDSSVKLVFVVLAVIALMATGATTRDLGLSLAHWQKDLTVGVFGFCMIAPLVLMLQAVLVKLWQPSAHPLIESLRANLTLECWLAVTIAAVIGAPIFEEFAFRVLFQGWLEGVCDSTAHPTNLELPSQIVIGNQAVDSTSPPNPYVSPTFLPPPPSTRAPERTPAGDVLPIVISSLVFALMHFGHGPDWVTLIPFAAMLGFLYRRTHRIWPSVVAHLMLNGFSMTMLTVSLFWPTAFPKA